jgi:hypothetical protein
MRVGLRVPVGSRSFNSKHRADLLWGPPNVLANGPGVKHTAHIELVPTSRNVRPLPIRRHGLVLN